MQNKGTNYFHGSIPFAEDKSVFPKPTVENELIGGRSEALKILKKLGSFGKYGRLRDFPAGEYSTHLSPYLKFTVCSPREVYAAICRNSAKGNPQVKIIRFRDFELGKTEIELEGVQIPIFNRERTIVDAFRLLSRETAIKALKTAITKEGKNRLDLVKPEAYAKQLRFDIAPYLLSVTA